MIYYALSGLINAFTAAFLGVFVFAKNSKAITNRTFTLFCATIAIWNFGYFFWQISGSEQMALLWCRILMIGTVLIPNTFLHYTLISLDSNKGWKNRFLLLGYVIDGIFLLFVFSPVFVSGVAPKLFFKFWPNPGPLFHIFFIKFTIYSVLAHFLLYKAYQRSTGIRFHQLRISFWGIIVGYIGGMPVWFLWYDIPVPPFTHALVSVYMLMLTYGIVKYKLLDIEVIIKKTLVFAGLFAASYAVFASFAYLGTMLFENVIHNRWIALIPSVFMIVLLLRPLESFLVNATDKFLFQKKYNYKELLKTFTNEVLTVLDLGDLVNLTVNKLTEIIKLESASVLLFDEENDEFRMAATHGAKVSLHTITGEEALSIYLRDKGQYVLLDDPARKEHLDVSVAGKINELEASLVVPLIHRDNMVGILSLGKKKSDVEFTQDDIDFILPLTRTLAIAIANARLFEKLAEAQIQAAQREKMAVIGTLSAGINHEICNPLGIARGQCEMFLLNLADGVYKDKSQEELLDQAQEIMKKVIHETDRATVITRKLSSFAKPAKGVVTDDVDIAKELDEVISLVEHELKLDDIFIKNDIEGELPCVSADRKQLQEILFNIVRNAAQSIEGRGEISVSAKQSGKKVEIDISDTGGGISKSNLERIFNPFFTTKEPGKGTGLGLFIVKQIVEKNGGTISVESVVDKGTTFHLVFAATEAKVDSVG